MCSKVKTFPVNTLCKHYVLKKWLMGNVSKICNIYVNNASTLKLLWDKEKRGKSGLIQDVWEQRKKDEAWRN